VKKLLTAFVFVLLVSLSAAAQSQQPIRVNCGGPAYIDSNGKTWQADFGFNVGTAGGNATTTVSGTNDPKLFMTDRWNSSKSTPLIYSFTVVDGTYNVNLYFAETSPPEESVGARVFNVSVEGIPFLQNFDIFSQAGGANKALTKSTTVNVTNGTLTIQFNDVVQNAVIQAIEILPATSAPSPTLTLNFNYPDGTPVAGTLGYAVSSSLLSFQGTSPLTNGQAQCIIYANPSALGISAQFTVNLSLTDTAGHTLWQFTVGMNTSQVNLAAVQSSALNVVVQKL